MICFTSFTKIFHLQFIRLYEDIFPFFRNILYCTFQKLELDNFLDLTNQKLHQNGAARIFCMSPNSEGIVLTHLPVSSGWSKTIEQEFPHYSGGTVQDSHLLPS
jgi:hypothetical protein